MILIFFFFFPIKHRVLGRPTTRMPRHLPPHIPSAARALLASADAVATTAASAVVCWATGEASVWWTVLGEDGASVSANRTTPARPRHARHARHSCTCSVAGMDRRERAAAAIASASVAHSKSCTSNAEMPCCRAVRRANCSEPGLMWGFISTTVSVPPSTAV